MEFEVVVSMSSNGTTHHVGQVIAATLKSRGVEVVSVGLAKLKRLAGEVLDRLGEDRSSLFVGSPVSFNLYLRNWIPSYRSIRHRTEAGSMSPRTSNGFY